MQQEVCQFVKTFAITAGGKAQLPVPGSGGVFANAFVALQKNLPSGLVAQKP